MRLLHGPVILNENLLVGVQIAEPCQLDEPKWIIGVVRVVRVA